VRTVEFARSGARPTGLVELRGRLAIAGAEHVGVPFDAHSLLRAFNSRHSPSSEAARGHEMTASTSNSNSPPLSLRGTAPEFGR